MTVLQGLASIAVTLTLGGLGLAVLSLSSRCDRIERNVQDLATITRNHLLREHGPDGGPGTLDHDTDKLFALGDPRTGRWRR